MKLLLDTQLLLWAAGQPERLPEPVVVARRSLGGHRAPHLEGAGVEAVSPPVVVGVGRHQEGPGPRVPSALVEGVGHGRTQFVVVEAQAGHDEAGVGHAAAAAELSDEPNVLLVK